MFLFICLFVFSIWKAVKLSDEAAFTLGRSSIRHPTRGSRPNEVFLTLNLRLNSEIFFILLFVSQGYEALGCLVSNEYWTLYTLSCILPVG